MQSWDPAASIRLPLPQSVGRNAAARGAAGERTGYGRCYARWRIGGIGLVCSYGRLLIIECEVHFVTERPEQILGNHRSIVISELRERRRLLRGRRISG